MRRSLLALCLIALATGGGITAVSTGDVCAQSNCRAKCVEEEQACLQRTGNKGQCGTKANECLAKCK